jgi:23S rRNA (uracil1939-C5)-methyltransferase
MMKLHKDETIELNIDKMAYGGRGIGRLGGFVVFLRGVVPGDRVRARIYRKKKGYAEASLVELIEPSPDRVQAPCLYSGYCGGCQWQHIRYEAQLSFKQEQVKESLKTIGGLKNFVVHNVLPSENTFAYRNKMEFSFSDRRWFLPHELYKREIEGDFALGLHVPGTYKKVIDVEACLLQQETGNRILREVKRHAKESRIPVYGLKSHEGYWRFLTIRYSNSFDEWMVNLVTSEKRQEVIRPLADVLSGQIEQIKTVVNNITRRKASIAVGEDEVVLEGKGHIRDKIGPFTFQISANSFFQTNSLAAQTLYETVADYAELKGNDMVLDLYSGTGTIPIFLADRAQAVTGIEINESAVLDARRNCEDNSIDNCRFIIGDIREGLSSINYRPDVMIIDPPRAGIHKDVLAQALALSAERIIYISCNPATMARDISGMAQDYELVEIQPVDMFPHTYHIEAVAKLWLRKSENKRPHNSLGG